MNPPKQSLTGLVLSRDVLLVISGPYAQLFSITYRGEVYYEVISCETSEVIYRTQNRFFAIRRFQETNQD